MRRNNGNSEVVRKTIDNMFLIEQNGVIVFGNPPISVFRPKPFNEFAKMALILIFNFVPK